ncbi:glycosyltransferase family 4 protein [Crocinitomix catalasitica]|uniref:glycosyltransferase family 4 protein n=1 Tax=Crocinitomix catalasitica TaxID=184607 RepID=UPI000481EBCD|nr:glycosyltransferase family 4 protein [Crocinitomix catalasitica]
MKKYNKIIVIGPNSVHVENFIFLIKDLFDSIVVVSEEVTEFTYVNSSHVISYRAKNPLTWLKENKKLEKIIVSEKPDFVHVQSINRQAFFASIITKRLKIPLIATAWGSDVLVVPKRNIVFKKMVQRVLDRSAYISADSYEMIDAIHHLSKNKNVKYILLGINTIEIKPKEQIIYSNRLHKPLYNIDKIINAFHQFSSSNPDWKLVIGAVGPETENLKTQVDQLNTNKIEFIGWLTQEENIKQYQKAKIYITIPSSDGTAVSLLEAMSAGCIPIVSDLTVSHEWIVDGENGVILKPSEENFFKRALSLDLEKVQQKNKEIISKSGTKQIATDSFQFVYKSVK